MKKIACISTAVLSVVACVLVVAAVEPAESFSLTDSRGLKLHTESSAIKQSDLDNNFMDYAEDEASVSLSEYGVIYGEESSLANVVGIVLDYDTESPIPGATISIGGEKVVTSGTDGRFQITDVVSKIYNWAVAAKGYYPAYYYNYPVDVASGTSIFRFYVSIDFSVEQDREDVINDHCGQEVPDELRSLV